MTRDSYDLGEDMQQADWFVAKCKNEHYAQNVYAALCNNQFIKNDIWPILKEEIWTTSWRGAGGLIADLRGVGDYMDWYCSGIRDTAIHSIVTHLHGDDADELASTTEGTVTPEVRADLLKLGWTVRPYPE
tara:strand:- start:2879 stop:3271 length:393 start_codon:yes stop_codon:yes gene_type:complete